MSKKENKSNKKEVIDETNEQELVEAFSSLLDSVTPEKTKKIKSKKQNYVREYREPNVEEVIIQEDKGLNVDVYAPTPKYPSMSMALDNYILKANKKK